LSFLTSFDEVVIGLTTLVMAVAVLFGRNKHGG